MFSLWREGKKDFLLEQPREISQSPAALDRNIHIIPSGVNYLL